LVDWWRKHPEAKENFMRVARPTRIEVLAREALAKRAIPFLTCKRVENLCFPDLVLPEKKIAIFCNGCFWHNCPERNPVVPQWLRNKIKDQQIFDESRKRGWRVLVAWEHEFKHAKDVIGQKIDELLAQGQGDG
jgi:DNA mismatch endonuclease (patch repair protein)